MQEEKTKATQQTTLKTIIRLTPEEITKYKQNGTDYFKYYEKRKGESFIIREIWQGKKDYKNLKPETVKKFKIEWNRNGMNIFLY